jgi:hypothetical protein
VVEVSGSHGGENGDDRLVSIFKLILSHRFRLGLPSGFFPSDFLTKMYDLLSVSFMLHAPPISSFLI